MSLVGELAAGLAHEVKNPLTGIQGAVDILIRRKDPSDPEREALENVRHEVGRIDATVRTILDHARPRAAQRASASLIEAVRRAVLLASDHSESAGLPIAITLTTDRDDLLMAIDAAQIEDAVLNLLLNATEAIEGDGRVEVRVHADDETATVEVHDSGRGISAEDLKRIFDPFYTTTPGGTGLGLPAVRRIARAHGGRVEVTSTPGEGSSFILKLPLSM
jgi:signal transduction histidine kinase